MRADMMMNLRSILIPLGLMVSVCASTAYADADRGYSHTGNSFISGIRVIDGLGNKPSENQDIAIIDGKIAAIGPSGSLEAPPNALQVDGAGNARTDRYAYSHTSQGRQVDRDSLKLK
jgi:hypothetical protein